MKVVGFQAEEISAFCPRYFVVNVKSIAVLLTVVYFVYLDAPLYDDLALVILPQIFSKFCIRYGSYLSEYILMVLRMTTSTSVICRPLTTALLSVVITLLLITSSITTYGRTMVFAALVSTDIANLLS